MQDHNGKDISVGAKVAILGTVTGIGEMDAGQVHVQTASGATVTVVPTDLVQGPERELVIEAPEDAPGAGGTGPSVQPKG